MYIENKVLNKYISLWLISMFWIIAIMIIVGGLTRLTDSGLSITQWQLFSGIFPPLNEVAGLDATEFFEGINIVTYKGGKMLVERVGDIVTEVPDLFIT